jgi:hypothetical protein
MHFFQVKNVGVWVMVNLIREKLSAYGIVHFHKTKSRRSNPVYQSTITTAITPTQLGYRTASPTKLSPELHKGSRLSDAAVQVKFTLLTDSPTGAAEYSDQPRQARSRMLAYRFMQLSQ